MSESERTAVAVALAAAQARIADLEAEAQVIAGDRSHWFVRARALAADTEAAEADARRLRELLRTHGQHPATCGVPRGAGCDCGLSAALVGG